MINKYNKYISESDQETRINIVKSETGKSMDAAKLIVPDIMIAGINKIIGDNYSIIHEMKLRNPDMQLICTGGKSKAAEAWIYGCNSYIIKPFKKEYFLKCLKSRLVRYEQIYLYNKYTENLAIKDDGKWVKLQYKDIIYFEKVHKKIRVIAKNKKYSFYGSLEGLCSIIDMDFFFQCHQGYIINRYRVKSFKDNEILLEGSNTPVPVSRRMRKKAIGLFEDFNSIKGWKMWLLDYIWQLNLPNRP